MINRDQLELLRADPEISNLLNSVSLKPEAVAALDDARKNQIVDMLAKRFSEIGLKEDSEPNRLCLAIERLLDIFNGS
ncbi:MAG: hypothetical protein WBW87_15395 [Candidatus Cybelea sp.]